MDKCSFCGLSELEVKKLLRGQDPNALICDSCIGIGYDNLDDEKFTNVQIDINPKSIKRELDKYVIGQEIPKKILSVAIYNHMLKIENNLNIQKGNILLIGPTGSGKTYLSQIMAKILKVPCIIADTTTLTESGYVGCFDCDTEYLSEYGWRKIKNYSGEKIAQYNPKTKQAEFIYPLYYHVLPETKLTKLQTKYKGLSQILSDEHNVYYLTCKNNLIKKRFKEIKKFHQESKDGFWGKFITTFKSPETKGIDFTDDELRLQIAIIADGTICNKNTNYCCFKLKKKRKVDRLLEILNKLNIDKSISYWREYTIIHCHSKTNDKYFDEKYYRSNQHQLNIIANECLYWDGNQKNQFYTSIESSADFIQYAFTVSGLRSSISKYERRKNPEFRVQSTKSIYPSLANKDGKIEMEDYYTIDGYKYCFTTPSGMLVARNNKCIFITGNSDVETIFQPLINKYSVEEISKSIIVLDEIDKKARKSGPNVSLTRDVSAESVQYSLLRMIEGCQVDVPLTGMRKHPHGDKITIDTSNILFIFSGAFVGLSDIIAKRLGKNEVGFGDKIKISKSVKETELLKQIEQDDLIQFGLIPELVGRIPIISTLDELKIDDLCRILTEPKDNLIIQYKTLLNVDNIKIHFSQSTIEKIAKTAYDKKIGARGLKSVIENIMIDFMFDVDRKNSGEYNIEI